MIKVYKKIKEITKIKEDLSFVINFEEFPNKIIDNKNWGSLILDSWSIFDKNSFEKFISFLGKVDCKEFYMCSSKTNNYNVIEYENQFLNLIKTDVSKSPIIRVNSNIDFFTYNQKIENDYLYSYVECYFFSMKYNWFLHYVPNKNLMILYYSNSIEKVISEEYYEQSLKSIEEIIESSENSLNNNEIEVLNKAWFNNPNSTSFI